MADSSAMADIRGINVTKLVTAFAEELNVLKKYCVNGTTTARQIRWQKKTAGFLDSADTTAITASQIANTSAKSVPVAVEAQWTQQNSYVRKYFVESPVISIEDIKDTQVSILATNIHDLTRAVARQVDARIYAAITGDGDILTGASTQDGWDDVATGDPIKDITVAMQQIRAQSYDPHGGILYINSIEHKNLINYLISVKGSSIPAFSSEKVRSGEVMEILGLKVVVSENATTDQALIFIPQTTAMWMTFTPITSAVVDDPGIGKKIRIWEEGECLVLNPKSAYLITDTAIA